jgi:hypothetical protein
MLRVTYVGLQRIHSRLISREIKSRRLRKVNKGEKRRAYTFLLETLMRRDHLRDKVRGVKNSFKVHHRKT